MSKTIEIRLIFRVHDEDLLMKNAEEAVENAWNDTLEGIYGDDEADLAAAAVEVLLNSNTAVDYESNGLELMTTVLLDHGKEVAS